MKPTTPTIMIRRAFDQTLSDPNSMKKREHFRIYVRSIIDGDLLVSGFEVSWEEQVRYFDHKGASVSKEALYAPGVFIDYLSPDSDLWNTVRERVANRKAKSRP